MCGRVIISIACHEEMGIRSAVHIGRAVLHLSVVLLEKFIDLHLVAALLILR